MSPGPSDAVQDSASKTSLPGVFTAVEGSEAQSLRSTAQLV
ncbi:hypothetical protein ACWG8W_12165 [Citricoccus zhacaiensis]|nr:hypothetical protein CITRIK5_70860 [Citricoccus sp. K5]